MNQRIFIDLALSATVVHHCALLRVIKDFHAQLAMSLANLSNASMHGVGTKLGTVQTLIARMPLVSSSHC
jgi:hypothetical protein